MMSSNGRSSFPFTSSQWQELEHQTLFFNYMVSGMPIPPDLLYTIRRSFDSPFYSSNLLLHQPQHFGFQMGFGRKIDPEPGRCKRTDGKKWRCSKDAFSDSKYCERHMHRGRSHRSRKPVEILSPKAATTTTTDAIPHISTSITKNRNLSSSSSTEEPQFLYPHFSSSTTLKIGLSFQESTTNFNAYSNAAGKDYRKSCGEGRDGEISKRGFFSEVSSNSGIMRNISVGSSMNDGSWQLEPLPQMKQKAAELQSGQQKWNHHYYNCGMHLNINERNDDKSKKVMHHFLDECPPKDKDSWLNLGDKMSNHRTQLSISTPNYLHDFFTTQKW